MIAERKRRGGRHHGPYPYEVPPPDHENWFRWEEPGRRSWTESAYIALALGVALVVLLLVLFGLGPVMALLG